MRYSCYIIVALFLVGGPQPAVSDTIHLKNGRSIDGVISRETADDIVLSLGVGTTTIRKSKIKFIERTESAQNSKIEDEWRKKHYLNRKYVPHDLVGLVGNYRKLLAQRDGTILVRRRASRTGAKKAALMKEIRILLSKLVVASKKMKDASPDMDRDAYNKIVFEVNARRGEMTIKQAEHDELVELEGKALEALSSYMGSLSSFTVQFDEKRREKRDGGKDTAYLFKKISAKLVSLAAEFKNVSVDSTRRGNSTIVTAIINNRIPGRFVLDTGASVVTISETFAARLGLDLTGRQSREMVLANGAKVMAVSLELKSVQLGGARVEHVSAVVMPSQPGERIDGLLGMSFLRNFVLSLDGATGKLLLKQFKPR